MSLSVSSEIRGLQEARRNSPHERCILKTCGIGGPDALSGFHDSSSFLNRYTKALLDLSNQFVFFTFDVG
jgi:hypothetical protein